MYCPNCQNRFDEFQNCYKSTEEVVDVIRLKSFENAI